MPVFVEEQEIRAIRLFWPKVEMGHEDACWIWTGATARPPRLPTGFFKLPLTRRNVMAHRAVFEFFCGPIPEGMCVLHSCDNQSCVNPNHLWLGTLGDNQADMRAKGRQAGGPNQPFWFLRMDAKPIIFRGLTEEQKLEVSEDPTSGAKLAKKYGVHRSTIDRARKRLGASRRSGPIKQSAPDGDILS